MDEKIYSDAQLVKEKNAEYSAIKNKLENALSRWSELSEELERLEKEFSMD